MTPIIRVQNLGKEYRIDHSANGATYATLRDVISRVALASMRGLRGAWPWHWKNTSEDVSRQPGAERPDRFWALQNVGFELQPGEVVGIIGRNGAGKSTLLKILSRITPPTVGCVELYGRVGSLLEVGTGFHPELTGRENVFLNAAILGMSRQEIVRKLDDIIGFSGVGRFVDVPVKRYSSGMVVRLGFAVAVHLEPEILIVDEVLSVGDAAFQRKCVAKMKSLASGGRTVLFVSHNLAAVQNLCSRAILLADGQVQADGPVSAVIARYLASVQAPVAPSRQGPLARSLDRKLELLSFDLGDESGASFDHALCGQDIAFTVTIHSETDIGPVTLLLAINDALETRLVQLNSSIAGYDCSLSAGTHTFQCRVPRLPLSPGTYQIDLKILSGRDAMLFASNVFALFVEPGDFFGTGRLPADPRWAGVCQVWHTWAQIN
jgi:lipopolysaccharide transport system ATP-binding protein